MVRPCTLSRPARGRRRETDPFWCTPATDAPFDATGAQAAHSFAGMSPWGEWRTFSDPYSGRPYYSNTVTGQSSWVWPPTAAEGTH